LRAIRPEALIVTGYGINCDYESVVACTQAGFSSHRVHINDIFAHSRELFKYKLVVFPGGFSYGDDLGSGVAFSSKLRFSVTRNGDRLGDTVMEYVESGGLILGICNGFQILVRLGIIPAVHKKYGEQQVTLAPNLEGYFIDRWVRLRVERESPNIFTRGIHTLRLPVRHGEGRMVSKYPRILRSIEENQHVSLRYCDERGMPTQEFPWNPNGSENAIAGICDPSGRIFGLMPHPEAALEVYQYPDWTKKREEVLRSGGELDQRGDGYALFKNAYEWVQ